MVVQYYQRAKEANTKTQRALEEEYFELKKKRDSAESGRQTNFIEEEHEHEMRKKEYFPDELDRMMMSHYKLLMENLLSNIGNISDTNLIITKKIDELRVIKGKGFLMEAYVKNVQAKEENVPFLERVKDGAVQDSALRRSIKEIEEIGMLLK